MKYIRFKLAGKVIYGELVEKYCHTSLGEFIRVKNLSGDFLQSFLVIKVGSELREFLYYEIPIIGDDDTDYITVELYVNPANDRQAEWVSEEEYLAAKILNS